LGGSNDVIGTDGSTLSTVYAKGSNLSLEPLDYGDSSLVGLWSFNEGTGTIAYDYSGNNSTGTWSGTQTGTNGYYSAGKIGPWAGTFSGANNNYVYTTKNLNITSNQPRTIAFWEKANTAGQNGVMVGTGQNTTCNLFAADVYNSHWYFNGYSASCDFDTGVVADANWNFQVLTYNGTNVTWYLNGTSIGSSVLTALNTLNAGTVVGNRFGADLAFTGLIDDVRIYNRALSASEIAAMYAGGK
jgi:hypothetical protein